MADWVQCTGFIKRVNHPDDIAEIETKLKTRLQGENNIFIRYQTDGGYMIAAITDYDGLNVEVSGMASGKWWHTAIYPDLFGFIFNALKCKRASFVVDKDNHKCISLLERGGCVRECELRGIDRYLYSMTPQDLNNG